MDTISKIDLSGGAGPKYRVLAGSIERAIHEGNLAPGDKMPTVRDLAFSLNITPGTVARAYQRLTEAGKLIAHVGRGTFVAGREAPAAPAEPPVIRPLP
ncbi:MAG: winged helix-turn-helix domain-containing protein, partial [Paracoccaceae bacterium]